MEKTGVVFRKNEKNTRFFYGENICYNKSTNFGRYSYE